LIPAIHFLPPGEALLK